MVSKQVDKRCSNCAHHKIYVKAYPCDECVDHSFWASSTESSTESPTESPINPAHYSRFPIQPLTFITENNLDYLQGNIIKYICRYPFKGGLEDLKKAQRYLEELIKKTEETANVETP